MLAGRASTAYNDDCGDDISGLGDDVALLAQETYNTDSEDDAMAKAYIRLQPIYKRSRT